MTIEEKLKNYILSRYKSIREFTQIVDIPYTTLDSILKRGVENSNVSNVIKICKILGLSVDELAEGRITPINNYVRDPGLIEVTDILADVKSTLIYTEGLTLDGKPADKESINSIVQGMTIAEELAKRNKV